MASWIESKVLAGTWVNYFGGGGAEEVEAVVSPARTRRESVGGWWGHGGREVPNAPGLRHAGGRSVPHGAWGGAYARITGGESGFVVFAASAAARCRSDARERRFGREQEPV